MAGACPVVWISTSAVQMPGLHRLPHGVSFESHNVIGIVGGIGQCVFPQAVGIGRLFPRAVIAFVDDALQWNPRLLHSADVIPEIHEQSGIRRQLSQPDASLVSS